MSEGKTPQTSLEERIDRALGEWPQREKSAIEWDESAEAVASRIASGEAGKTASIVSDEDLLRDPLAASADEMQTSAALGNAGPGRSGAMTTTQRERDRSSLQELAKLASMAPAAPAAPVSDLFGAGPASAKEPAKGGGDKNSGVIDLSAIAAADPHAPARAKATPLASQGLFDDDAASTAPRPPLSEKKADEAAKADAPAVEAVAAKPAVAKDKAEKKGGSLAFLAVGGVVAAAAVAAGVFFGMKHGKSDAPSSAPVAMKPPAAATAQPAAVPAAATAQPTDQAIAANTPSPDDKGGASMPMAGNGAFAPKAGALAPAATATTAAVAAASAAAPPPASAATDPNLVAKVPSAPAATGSEKSLQDLMQQAAGTAPSAPAAAPKADDSQPQVAPGSVPLKPAMGAVQGALGAVVPSARACLGPDDAVSHATVVFKSDGSVQSVSVSGGAAGKPAEGCIRAALSKAHVPPFAQPTFTTSATIRGS